MCIHTKMTVLSNTIQKTRVHCTVRTVTYSAVINEVLVVISDWESRSVERISRTRQLCSLVDWRCVHYLAHSVQLECCNVKMFVCWFAAISSSIEHNNWSTESSAWTRVFLPLVCRWQWCWLRWRWNRRDYKGRRLVKPATVFPGTCCILRYVECVECTVTVTPTVLANS